MAKKADAPARGAEARVGPGAGGLGEPLRSVLGERTASAFATHLDLFTVGDLLRHYPRRYYERGELTELSQLRVGETVTISARIARVSGRHLRGRLFKTDVVVTDGTGTLTVTFFAAYDQRARFPIGGEALFAGKVESFRGSLSLTNPEFHMEADAAVVAGALVPIYRAAAKVPTWTIARAVGIVLDTLGEVDDGIPADVRARHSLLGLREALVRVHRPASRGDVERAARRLKWDEALPLQVVLARRRAEQAAQPAIARPGRVGGLLDAFDARLPFALTSGQAAVSRDILDDLARPHPMHRLLHGEVGSGKTLVALRAMLAVVDSGGQAALLAPTEVLAVQHHRTLLDMLGPLAQSGLLGSGEDADIATRVVLLTGSASAGARRRALLDAASGQAGIVVGTHALLQESVAFTDLGLVVVDEQHRFGVEQRDALRGKAATPPHLLVMTATPIPRTVAMTVFGDLSVSTLADLPPGRSPIATYVVPADRPRYLERTWQRVREEVAAGSQAYVVCPRIGESSEGAADSDGDGIDSLTGGSGEGRPVRGVIETAAELAAGPLADLRLGILHGRLPAEAKDAVMGRFASGALEVLVATTVVEVGVDVPNATVMVVVDADRFGVAQLHQLRGRVGRGSKPGLCLLVSEAAESSAAALRLEAVASTLDGFALSRVDLEARREGDVLGASQSGRRSSLRLLSVLRDEDLIGAAREEAVRIVAADPAIEGHPGLAAMVRSIIDEDSAGFLQKG